MPPGPGELGNRGHGDTEPPPSRPAPAFLSTRWYPAKRHQRHGSSPATSTTSATSGQGWLVGLPDPRRRRSPRTLVPRQLCGVLSAEARAAAALTVRETLRAAEPARTNPVSFRREAEPGYRFTSSAASRLSCVTDSVIQAKNVTFLPPAPSSAASGRSRALRGGRFPRSCPRTNFSSWSFLLR